MSWLLRSKGELSTNNQREKLESAKGVAAQGVVAVARGAADLVLSFLFSTLFFSNQGMAEDGCCRGGDGTDLLAQLELILERDPLIDEVGFLHPSQLATLNEDSGGSLLLPTSNLKSADKILNTDIDTTTFWISNHKLAISTEMLPQLYTAAMHAYVDARRSYEELINSSNATSGANFVHFLENDILKHTRVLLILSCDFSSAWNSRKLVLSRKHILSLFIDEFQLSKLILSFSQKSDYAWSHRRWVIKMMAEQFQNLQEIVEKESELVKEIAEQSKMNYHAWNHRCWLVPYMTKTQVLNELNKSRKWAEFHVADNSCFHYRRQLMLRMLENTFVKLDGETFFTYESEAYFVWKEELRWNELLIERYIGREALWLHRRFLSDCWIKHLSCSQQALISSPELDVFLLKELQLLHTCLNTPVDEFVDTRVQAQHAASYILWILKQIPLPQMSMLQDKLREVGELKDILMKTYPERTILWESLCC